MIFVVGKTGLVGSAICRYFDQIGLDYVGIDRKNYSKWAGKRTDVVINCNGSGLKWKANSDPKSDFEVNVASTMNFVSDFEYRLFIHVSSVDVYNHTASQADTNEDTVIDPLNLEPYGFDKYLSEVIVKKYCPRWLILRLGGLVGPGLKKNQIYDWTHGKPLMIDQKSIFGFIHTTEVAGVINFLVNRGIKNQVFNVTSRETIKLEQLPLLAPIKILIGKSNLPVYKYEINVAKLNKLYPIRSAREYIIDYLTQDLKIAQSN